MTSRIKSFIAAALLSATGTAFSQTLEKAYVFAEPLQYSKSGEFRGCGVNIKLLQISNETQRDYLTVSLNFVLDHSEALVKTTFGKAAVGEKPSVVQQAVESTWARLKGEDPLRAVTTMKGENHAILTTVELASALKFVTAVLGGDEEIQVGFKTPVVKYERVFYGKPIMESESIAQIQSCFRELAGRLNVQGEAQ